MNAMKLSKEDLVINNLRSVFEQYGYAHFKMSKFEEYDLYVRNKDFLISDSIITGESLPAEERQESFRDMMELGLSLI